MKKLCEDTEKQKRNEVIRAMRGSHGPTELAEMFGLSRPQIYNILKDQDELQLLLDRAVYHENKASAIHQRIRELRGSTQPDCFGMDDCSTHAMSQCAWRKECGEKAEIDFAVHQTIAAKEK